MGWNSYNELTNDETRRVIHELSDANDAHADAEHTPLKAKCETLPLLKIELCDNRL